MPRQFKQAGVEPRSNVPPNHPLQRSVIDKVLARGRAESGGLRWRARALSWAHRAAAELGRYTADL